MLIRADDIHFTYSEGEKVLNGVSVTIQPGEKVALVGQNGSGKTTLARHLNGLLRPATGQVWIGDWLTQDHSPAQMARRVAYVFQNPDEQLFHQRVWDEVAFGPQNLGCSVREVAFQVERALDLMDLRGASDLNPRDLGYSGRKRVTLASALAMQTPIIVFDEPTAGLDSKEQEQLAGVFSLLHHQGKTIIVISHDMDFLIENMDRMLLMMNGKIALDASARDFFEQNRILETSGLIAPQIVRLSQKMGCSQVSTNVDEFLDNFS